MNIKVRRFVSNWMPVIAWMLVIFAGSSDVLSAEHTSRFLVPFLRWLDPAISIQAIAAIHFALRKIGHFTEYAVLAFLMWRALRDGLGAVAKSAVAAAVFLITAGFAISDEFHQSFVPSRTSSAHDVMIDCIGALVAVLFCMIFARSNRAYETASK